MADKVQEAELKKRAPRGSKGTKPKVVDREGDRGSWYPCKIEEGPMKLLLDEVFLRKELMTYIQRDRSLRHPRKDTQSSAVLGWREAFLFRHPSSSWTS